MTQQDERDMYIFAHDQGCICLDPDWPKTFVLKDAAYDILSSRMPKSNQKEANGIPYIFCGKAIVRRENPPGLSLLELWEEMNEKENSAKSTDL